MKLADLMNNSLSEMLCKCDVVKVDPISNDGGEIKKIIIEYVPTDTKKDIDVPKFNRFNG